MSEAWQDKTTGQWFRRVPATEDIVAETGKSWMDVPVAGAPPPSPPAEQPQDEEKKSDFVDIALDAGELGLDILGSGIDAGLGLIGDIAGGLADLT
jgi:hypothetical protein